MKNLYKVNFLSRFIFLLITPVFFQFFVLGFIWHSIYWGIITVTLILWTFFILVSPLFGRIGCGWFCFMGTTSDMSGQCTFFKMKWKKPRLWLRLLLLILFFASAFVFYILNKERGLTHGFAIIPSFLPLNFDMHYKVVWMIDIFSAAIISFFLSRRWMCKNMCVVGTLCSAGANYSRLLPVVDESCSLCGKCEKECLVAIPITDYIKNNDGLITNSECILCGKCTEVCHSQSISLKFVWNRSAHRAKRKNVQQKN